MPELLHAERYLASGECRDAYLQRYTKGPWRLTVKIEGKTPIGILACGPLDDEERLSLHVVVDPGPR